MCKLVSVHPTGSFSKAAPHSLNIISDMATNFPNHAHAPAVPLLCLCPVVTMYMCMWQHANASMYVCVYMDA